MPLIDKRLSRWDADQRTGCRVCAIVIDDKSVVVDMIDGASTAVLAEVTGSIALPDTAIHVDLARGHGELVVENDDSSRATSVGTYADTTLC